MANANGKNSALMSQLQGNKPVAHNPIKALLEAPAIKKRFEQVLDKRSAQFMSSIVNLVQSDTNLSKCEPMSVIGACMVAATLNLPVDKNLGYAWVIPYGTRGQFQLGYKGYIQLALRTSQYKHINAIEVYEGELIEFNRLTEELTFDQSQKKSDHIIGYAAYFELLNGFKKTVYWTREQVEAHKNRHSKQAHGKVWKDDFDAMAMKTVLKNMLSKWGILSVEMQQAFADDEQSMKVNESGDLTQEFIELSPEDMEKADNSTLESVEQIADDEIILEPIADEEETK